MTGCPHALFRRSPTRRAITSVALPGVNGTMILIGCDVQVGVGYHSGSHYSAIQALEPFLAREEIALDFAGRPFDRVRAHLEANGVDFDKELATV